MPTSVYLTHTMTLTYLLPGDMPSVTIYFLGPLPAGRPYTVGAVRGAGWQATGHYYHHRPVPNLIAAYRHPWTLWKNVFGRRRWGDSNHHTFHQRHRFPSLPARPHYLRYGDTDTPPALNITRNARAGAFSGAVLYSPTTCTSPFLLLAILPFNSGHSRAILEMVSIFLLFYHNLSSLF